jgi:hypothetical protein
MRYAGSIAKLVSKEVRVCLHVMRFPMAVGLSVFPKNVLSILTASLRR